MRGSKRERSPGVWELRVYIGTHDGTERRISRTWPPKDPDTRRRPKGSASGADKALRALIKEVEDGKHRPRHAGTVAEVLERWLTDRHRDWAPRTRADNRYFVNKYLTPALGTKDAAKLRPDDLKKLYARLADEVGVPTARRAHVHLHAAFAEAVRSDELASNPCDRVRPPRAAPKVEREVAIADVVEVMRRAIAAGDVMMATLIRVAFATGARRGELGALRWSDVDLETGRVTIGRALTAVAGVTSVKGTKRGNTKRLAIDDGTTEMLRRWKAECDRTYTLAGLTMAETWFIWGGDAPMHPDTITKRWTRLRDGDPEGDPPVPKIPLSFHDIRHATASFMASSGVGPAEGAGRLGNTPAVFLGTYSHAAPEKDRPIANAIGAAIDEALA